MLFVENCLSFAQRFFLHNFDDFWKSMAIEQVAYPVFNPYSSGVQSVSTWTLRTATSSYPVTGCSLTC